MILLRISLGDSGFYSIYVFCIVIVHMSHYSEYVSERFVALFYMCLTIEHVSQRFLALFYICNLFTYLMYMSHYSEYMSERFLALSSIMISYISIENMSVNEYVHTKKTIYIYLNREYVCVSEILGSILFSHFIYVSVCIVIS